MAKQHLLSSLIACTISLSLSACSTVGHFGNHLSEEDQASELVFSRAAISKIEELYAPAKVQFQLKHPAEDSFGQQLIKGLREKGYALVEHVPPPAFSLEETEPEQPKATIAGYSTRELPLQYILDRPGQSDLYRLSLLIDGQALSRAYVLQNDKLYPAGQWVRQENR